MKLIDNWKQAWKLKSIQSGALWAFFYVCMAVAFEVVWFVGKHFPDFWAVVPAEIKALLPYSWVTWLGFLNNILNIFARLRAQPELHQQPLGFVTVTAGHSNTDPGAVNGKLKESEFVVTIRNALAYYLREAGIQIKTDGVGTQNDPLSSAVKLIKGSSVALEIHMNAAANKSATGIETISLPKDKLLAQKISKAVQNITGSKLRGENGWIDQSKSARGRLAFIENGGLILEVGFISNDAEAYLIQSKAWLIAREISKVLIEHEKALK